MDDEAFAALQTRVSRLENQLATALAELLAELRRRESGETATVTPLFTRGEADDDDA